MENQQVLNAHLAKLNFAGGPVTEATFELDMRGFKFFQGSGHVPPGIYALTCEESAFVPKKGDKGGANWMTVWRVNGPAEFAGVKIVENHPVPMGSPSSAGLNFASAISGSVFSGLGILEKIKAQDKNTKLTLKWFLGKVAYAELQSDYWEGREYSKVRGYVSKEDFDKSPGPFTALASGTDDAGLPDGSFSPPEATPLRQATTVQSPPEIASHLMTQQAATPPVMQQPVMQTGGNSGATASDVADITSFFE